MINNVYCLEIAVYMIFFFTRHLDNAIWLHGADVTIMLFVYFGHCLHTAVTNLHYVSVEDGTFKLCVASEGKL